MLPNTYQLIAAGRACRNAMLPLMQNYEQLKQLIADMDSSQAKGGLLRDKIIEMESVSFKAQKALHAIKAFGGQIGATLLPVITGLAQIAQPFLTVIGWFAEHFPKITAATITGLALVYVIGIERSIRFASALGHPRGERSVIP